MSDGTQGDDTDTEAIQSVKDESAQPRRRRGRRTFKILGTIFAVLLIIVIGVVAADQHIARYILTRQLNAIGIDAEGVGTLDINLLNQEITAGPVSFRAADSIPGQIESAGVKISFKDLFSRRALAQQIILDGIDFRVTRTAEGGFALNGVSLAEAMADDGEQPVEDEDETGPGWGAGVDSFELRNTKIFFDDETRGDLTIEVDSLTLNGFRTWEPDSPGTFELNARVNDIAFDWEGEAMPFGDTVVAKFQGILDGVDLDKITQYSGPLGFSDRSGTLTSDTRHELTISPDGQIDLTTQGQLTYRDFVNSRPDGVKLQTDRGVIDIDGHYVLTPENVSKITGATTWTLEPFVLDLLTGTVVSTERLRLEASDLNVTLGDGAVVRGPFTIDFGSTYVTIDSGMTVAADGAHIHVPDLAVTSAEATSIKAAPIVETTALSITVPEGPTIDAGTARLEDPELDIELGTATKIRGTPRLTATDFSIATDANVNVDQATVALVPFAFDQGGTDLSISTAGSIDLDGVGVTLAEAASLPAVNTSVSEINLQFRDTDVDITGAELAWQTVANALLTSLDVRLGDGTILSANVDKITVTDVNAAANLLIDIDEIDINRLDLTMNDKLFDAFAGTQPPSDDAPSGTSGDQSAAKLRIGKAAIGNGSTVRFTDTAVEPQVTLNSTIERFQIDKLDMTDPRVKTDVAIAALINDFTKTNASGWVAPWGEKPDFDLTTRIVDLELPTFSPYAAKAVGVHLDSGVLSTTAGATAASGQLDGLVETKIVKMKFATLSKEDAERLSANVGVPIETVVGLLEDKNGVINISIPVSGDLENPDFDLSDAIGQAISGALTAAITAPFSLLFAPVEAVADAASGPKQSFRPVTFKPELAEPDSDGMTILEELSKLLRERPEINLKTCGRATSADLEAFLARNGFEPKSTTNEQTGSASSPNEPPPEPPAALVEQAKNSLSQLALDRTRAVRRAVIDRYQLQADRLGECRYIYNPDDTKPPRAEITF
jgi:hypothetical protein